MSGVGNPKAKKVRRRPPKRLEVRVVFDTSAIWVESPTSVVRAEVETLLESPQADLDVRWYVPHAVRHERQRQMLVRAAGLLPRFTEMSALLGLPIQVDEATLADRLEDHVGAVLRKLQVSELNLDSSRVDWPRVAMDALYRKPPFDPSESEKSEKGFRDSLVVEAFVQLVEDSPASRTTCRIAFVSNDVLQREALTPRIATRNNVSVLPDIEELKNLLNTLSSQVGEDYVAYYRPLASKLFYEPGKPDSLFFKLDVRGALETKHAAVLNKVPSGASRRQNGTWRISGAVFDHKSGQRVTWKSRVEVPAELFLRVASSGGSIVSAQGLGSASVLPGLETVNYTFPASTNMPRWLSPSNEISFTLGDSTRDLLTGGTVNLDWPAVLSPPRDKLVGRLSEVFDVKWSVTITTAKKLIQATIDDVTYVETHAVETAG